MTFVVTQNCCNDATCVDVCPVDCIHPAPGEVGYASAEILHIDPAVCIDCGACAEVCPVVAISPDFDLAPDQLGYLELAVEYFEGATEITSRPAPPAESRVTRAETVPDLRVAIVGTGPAALYAAGELLSRRDIRAEVTFIERLPFAGGLVRYGVAPDHERTKAIDTNFQRTLRHPDVTAYFGVEVGVHLSIGELVDHHHAVIVASGATDDRRLGIPGEHLPGSHSAREFVAWYNGHPDYADLTFDLSHRRTVVVGNGNVALDVGRILVSDLEKLRRTDIADHALDALSASAVREVVILGRRGPAHAACTTPELIGLDSAPGFDVCVDGEVPLGMDLTMKQRLFATFASRLPDPEGRRITFRFNQNPTEIVGSPTGVTGIRVNGPDDATDTVIECGLVLRSIGYRGAPISGLSFDHRAGVVSNDAGRITGPETAPGLYVAGWLKRGPTGVIGTNRSCARETVAAVIDDHRTGQLAKPAHGKDALRQMVDERAPGHFGTSDWFAVDRSERVEGRRQARPRVKLIAGSDVRDVVAGAQRVRP